MLEMYGKTVTVILWLLVGYQWTIGMDGTFGTIIHYTGWFILIAHAVECVVMFSKIKATGDVRKHLILTYIFGYFHWNTL